MKLTRQVTFSSGHRYWIDTLSEHENRARFGRWASPYNHGHNYVLEASIRGRIDDETGMVVNIKDLDEILQDRVVSRFDQKSINDEVDGMIGLPPTLELIGTHIFESLRMLSEEAELCGVRLYETPTLFVDVSQNGEDMNVTLTRVYEFCASHRLHLADATEDENLQLFGKCNNPNGHGHNYILEVSVSGPVNPQTGMIANLQDIDDIVNREVVDRYDHKHLNVDIPEFRETNPTSEVIVRTIWHRLDNKLPAKLDKVLLRETARNIFEYSGDDE